MKTRILSAMAVAVMAVALWGCKQETQAPATTPATSATPATAGTPLSSGGQAWQEEFTIDKAALRNTGHNTYFILDPGHTVTLEGNEGQIRVQVIIKVLDQTEMVDGVNCRVVEERESKNGKIVEISRNFFAIDPATNNIYYFGEDVDNYGPDGRVRDHSSAWRSGVNGARFGMIMPGQAAVGQKYYQEQAEADEAMDRAEHISISETMESPAGRLTNCLKTEESSPLEPGHVSVKMYAPGIGMIRDGALQLVSCQRAR